MTTEGTRTNFTLIPQFLFPVHRNTYLQYSVRTYSMSLVETCTMKKDCQLKKNSLSLKIWMSFKRFYYFVS